VPPKYIVCRASGHGDCPATYVSHTREAGGADDALCDGSDSRIDDIEGSLKDGRDRRRLSCTEDGLAARLRLGRASEEEACIAW